MQKSGTRGRPNGVLRGELRAGAKLNVIETLRAAAPWQPLRQRETMKEGARPRILIRKDDMMKRHNCGRGLETNIPAMNRRQQRYF